MLLKLLALTLPLCLDCFLMAAAIGISRPRLLMRLRISVFFAVFEGGMPLAGLAMGAALRGPLGTAAKYIAALVLIGFGLYTVFNASKEDENARKLVRSSGLAMIGLGLGISLDGLALGFTYGILRLPVALITAVIVGQAFVAAQLGFSLGAKISGRYRELGEKLAGWALVLIGLLVAFQTAA